LQTFSNGCTAMTGVEAVSNGVRAFREPTDKNAQRTLTVIIGFLILLLAGIGYLVRVYRIAATDPGAPGYQSVLSMLIAAVTGRGPFYYVTIASILVILALSANTAFADFPRLCRAIAQHNYFPHSFSVRGRRLVYSQGIWVLAVLAAFLLILFGGVTDRLIPLFAVGAFLAFTLSQAGMVGHWRRNKGPGSTGSLIVNALGATATGVTLLVVLVAKFASGAWVTLLLIPIMLIFMMSVRHHYHLVSRETHSSTPLVVRDIGEPVVIMPIDYWGKISKRALLLALNLSSDIRAVHVRTDEDKNLLAQRWTNLVDEPVREAGLPLPKLVVLPSPFRFILLPIVSYVQSVEAENPTRLIAVIIPELVERHWYHYFLHNNRAAMLKWLLNMRGGKHTIFISVPWFLKA
jgi:hypothetical protein